jgi:hypothetical protein
VQSQGGAVGRRRRLAGSQRPVEGSLQVVSDGGQAFSGDQLPGGVQQRSHGLRQLEEVARVALLCLVELAAFDEPLTRVRVHGLQQANARLVVEAVDHLDEGGIRELGDRVQWVEIGAAHRLHRVQVGWAGERAEAAEHDLKLGSQQVMAPGDRVAQRAVPLRPVRSSRRSPGRVQPGE